MIIISKKQRQSLCFLEIFHFWYRFQLQMYLFRDRLCIDYLNHAAAPWGCIFCTGAHIDCIGRPVAMCGNTKQRIADALRQLMNEKPFDKITVRNLMDATNMKRQSFYYHFKDTRDVLMWICRQNFIRPMAASPLEFTDWVIAGMDILAADRSFYRRAITAVYEEFATEFNNTVMIPRTLALLYPGAEDPDDDSRFAATFFAQSFTVQMVRFVRSHRQLDASVLRERIDFLREEFLYPR